MNMQDVLKAVIPILVACIAWLLGQVSSFQTRLTQIEGKMPALITNTFADKYMTSDMQWGVEQEAAAKEAFETRTGLMVKDVGFIDHPSIDHCGVSPDGFVSDGCLIEVKCPKTKTHMKYVANQAIPPEYKPQMLLQSACTGKDIWFVSYDPRMGEGKDLFIKKYVPTPEELAEVEAAAEKFLAECDALFEFFNDESNYFDKGSF